MIIMVLPVQRQAIPIYLYLLAALAVTFPWFSRGQIFLLDMVYGPHMQLSDYIGDGLPAHWPLVLLQYGLNQLLPIGIIQALLLTAVLWLIGWAGFQLARRWFSPPWSLLVGLLLLFNPYVFERLAAGQWLVLLGFGLFPLAIKMSANLLDAPSFRHSLRWIVLMALYPMASLHWWYISILTLSRVLIAHHWPKPSLRHLFPVRVNWLSVSKQAVFTVAWAITTLLANSPWLLTATSNASSFSKISINQLPAFTAPGNGWEVAWRAVQGYGFWQTDYLMPLDIWPWWWIGGVTTLLFSCVGLYWWLKQDMFWSISLALAALVSLVTVTVASTWPDAAISILSRVPGAAGLRDTTKLIGVVSMFLTLSSVFGARWIAGFIGHNAIFKAWPFRSKIEAVLLSLVLVIAPITIVPFMVGGLGSQVRPSQYPVDWAQANRLIQQQPGVVLALPWQAYIRHSLAYNRIIANPVKVAIDQPVITSALLNQIRLDATQSPLDDAMQAWLQQDHSDLKLLQNYHMRYILLQKEADWQRYLPALEQTTLVIMYDGPKLRLYKMP